MRKKDPGIHIDPGTQVWYGVKLFVGEDLELQHYTTYKRREHAKQAFDAIKKQSFPKGSALILTRNFVFPNGSAGSAPVLSKRWGSR